MATATQTTTRTTTEDAVSFKAWRNTNAAFTIAISLVWAVPSVVSIPVPANLLITTLVIIYVGCHRSLKLRDKEATPLGTMDIVQKDDAMKFPLVGSAVLFGLFVVLKLLDKSLVNLLLSIYFSLIGAFSLQQLIEPITAPLRPSGPPTLYGKELNIPMMGPVDLRFTVLELACWAIALPITALYFNTKHWMLNNMIGIAFCIKGIETLSLGSFKVGVILLSGLFFYDIFWVFGTDKLLTGDSVMVTVAKSLDAPIKLLFPKTLAAEKLEFSILGLGDIVIPGLLVALLLRYDSEQASAPPPYFHAFRFSKPYFSSCLVSYVLGLALTVFIMDYFKAAQPALLYLVPACVGSALLLGLARGQLGALFAYDEDDNDAANSSVVVEGEGAATSNGHTEGEGEEKDGVNGEAEGESKKSK